MDLDGIVLASCRLPYGPHGPAHAAGGVTSALLPYAHAHAEAWVGLATGADSWSAVHAGVAVHGVGLDDPARRAALDGFANSTLWPVLHGRPRPPVLAERWWHAYVGMNRRVADRIVRVSRPGATVWVHDYQLLLVPALLRAARPDLDVRFFLHTPFPDPDELAPLPWARDLVAGVLGARCVGVQEEGSAAHLDEALAAVCDRGEPRPLVEVHPVPVDAADVAALAATPATVRAAAALRARLGSPRTLLLGIDRLDYIKGVDLRLLAVERLLTEGVVRPGEVRMLQIAPPCRLGSAHYERERRQVHALVTRITDRFGENGPVVVLDESTASRPEAVAAMVAADVLVVSSRRDGMNLVAKEFVASRTVEPGALVLSTGTGASRSLLAAYLVDPEPHDIARGLAAALTAPAVDRRCRMDALQAVVGAEDPMRWATACTQSPLALTA